MQPYKFLKESTKKAKQALYIPSKIGWVIFLIIFLFSNMQPNNQQEEDTVTFNTSNKKNTKDIKTAPTKKQPINQVIAKTLTVDEILFKGASEQLYKERLEILDEEIDDYLSVYLYLLLNGKSKAYLDLLLSVYELIYL
jgi:hypothetical protein